MTRVAWALAALAAAVSVAAAAERIRFKNGHTLEVRSSEVRGDRIALRLLDGSEISIPRDLVELVEAGHTPTAAAGPSSNWSGRGPSFTELHGYRQAMAARPGGERLLGSGIARQGGKGGAPVTFGFSWRGSGDIADANRTQGPRVDIRGLAREGAGPAPARGAGAAPAGEAAPPAAPGGAIDLRTAPAPSPRVGPS